MLGIWVYTLNLAFNVNGAEPQGDIGYVLQQILLSKDCHSVIFHLTCSSPNLILTRLSRDRSMFSSLKLSGLLWLYQLTESCRNDPLWFLKWDHKSQYCFLFFVFLESKTWLWNLQPPWEQSNCPEAVVLWGETTGKGPQPPESPVAPAPATVWLPPSEKWETLSQACPARSSQRPEGKIVAVIIFKLSLGCFIMQQLIIKTCFFGEAICIFF